MDSIEMQTPLNGVSSEIEGLMLSELPPAGRINLRGDFSSAEMIAAIETVTGLSPNIDANTCVNGAEYSLFWLGPDELLLH